MEDKVARSCFLCGRDTKELLIEKKRRPICIVCLLICSATDKKEQDWDSRSYEYMTMAKSSTMGWVEYNTLRHTMTVHAILPSGEHWDSFDCHYP